VVIIFTVFGLLTIDPLFRKLGADPEMIPLIRQYMEIWYLGLVFLIVPIMGNNALRAAGNTVFPSIIMFVAFVTNVILDPIMIFGLFGFPRMELRGAALATLIARISTLVVSLYLLYAKEKMLTLQPPKFKELINSWKSILHVGLPSVATNLINPLAISITTAMVASFGVVAVAAYGVVSRIEMFVVMILAALSSVIGPFVGQNWGCGKYERVDKALNVSFIFCTLWGLFSAVVLILFGEWIAGLFTDNPEVISIAKLYFLILPVCYGALGLVMVSTSSFNSMGMPYKSTAVIVIRTLVFYLPLAYLGKITAGLPGIFFAASFANIVTGLGFYYWNKKTCLHPACKVKQKNS